MTELSKKEELTLKLIELSHKYHELNKTKLECKVILEDLLKENKVNLNRLHLIRNKAVISTTELIDGYLPIIEDMPSKELESLLSKEIPPIRVLILRGNNIGNVIPLKEIM